MPESAQLRERSTRWRDIWSPDHESAAAPSSAHGGRRQTWSLSRLYLRRSPLGRRFTMVDAASKATPSPLRAPRRAPAEKCLLTVDVDEKSCTCPCVPDVLCWEL